MTDKTFSAVRAERPHPMTLRALLTLIQLFRLAGYHATLSATRDGCVLMIWRMRVIETVGVEVTERRAA